MGKIRNLWGSIGFQVQKIFWNLYKFYWWIILNDYCWKKITFVLEILWNVTFVCPFNIKYSPSKTYHRHFVIILNLKQRMNTFVFNQWNLLIFRRNVECWLWKLFYIAYQRKMKKFYWLKTRERHSYPITFSAAKPSSNKSLRW